MDNHLPYLTREWAGIGGAIKQRPEDFFVQELPLYEPCGEGEHLYVEIQKVGLTTFDAVNRIAHALNVSSREIGYAGLKDARAITRQLISIPKIPEQSVMNLQLPGISVLRAARHTNKLRLGHLRGNRFAIKIRSVEPTSVVRLGPVLQTLQKRGMPNYFGEQRFGRRGDNDRLGAALIRGSQDELLKLLLGSPDAMLDDPQTRNARTLFDEGKLQDSLDEWPGRFGLERQILTRLIKIGRSDVAVNAIDRKLRRLWISALQSRIFNEVVTIRLQGIDRLLVGDLAYKHGHGAVFLVEDAVNEQPRCDAFEISPSGPLVGHRMTLPEAEPLRIEERIFASFDLSPAHFRQEGRDHARGERRPLRVQPQDSQLSAGVDEFGGYVTVAFTLPPGSYATVLLRELMKSEDQVGGTVSNPR